MIVTVPADGRLFLDRIDSYLSEDDATRVRLALTFAREKHIAQKRKTGEPFVVHPMTVAYYLAEYQLDADAIIAALLHDVAEDTIASVADIAALFGDGVGRIVDGLTKVEEAKDENKRLGLKHSATLSKLFNTMIEDERVALIKIFDRLHNLRTIHGMPPHKQVKKAEETLEIYAKIAYHLGMWQVYNELTELAVATIDRPAYEAIEDKLAERDAAFKSTIKKIKRGLKAHLKAYNIDLIKVQLSPRSVHKIYKSQNVAERGYRALKIDQTPRILVLVQERIECYESMGVAHKLWAPQIEEFHDYIGGRSDNLYRALHTAVVVDGQMVKLRFRTPAMVLMSNQGILTKWSHEARALPSRLYLEVDGQVTALMRRINRNLLEDRSAEGVIDDVLTQQISVYSPRGDRFTMPVGATPVDFAYRIHTDVGHRCRRVFVNNHAYPLNEPLKDNDIVNVVAKNDRPRRIWLVEELGYLTTRNAKRKAREWFRHVPTEQAILQGKRLLEMELRMLGLPLYSHEQIADMEGLEQTDDLYLALGRASKLITDISTKVLVQHWHTGTMLHRGHTVTAPSGEQFWIFGARGKRGLKLCGYCNPRPGDQLRGYILKNGKVTVHRDDCGQITTKTFFRLLQLRWGEESKEVVRLTTVYVQINDRPHLLRDLTDLLDREVHTINIASLNWPHPVDSSQIRMCLEMVTPRQLVSLLHRIKALVNVTDVYVNHEESTYLNSK